MNVLIIGGTGLISTEVTRALLKRGHHLTHYNRGKRKQAFDVPIRTLYGDRHDRGTFEAQIQRMDPPPDCVIDMIGYTPEDAESTIHACRRHTRRLIFCSTVDVYAKPAARYPVTESEPYGPLSTYAERKVECEKLLSAAHQAGAFGLTIIRPAHTYGDRGAIIHAFDRRTSWLDRVRNGKPLIIHGDGTALWTAARAEDVGPAFAAAVDNPQAVGRSYHVTAEEWLTWTQYYEQVAAALGATLPELVHIPAADIFRLAGERGRRAYENFQYCNIYDNSAAKNDLGYTYTIPFADGVKKTVAWLDANGGIEEWQDDEEYDALIGRWTQR
ncbi:MAG: NAD-dependent epimerase/dehydratase family protein [Kiritimatiellae bacterium]|nr:NAD-dependent epimerase/dehydratase family protein [Kiritimatiellia bacterium]